MDPVASFDRCRKFTVEGVVEPGVDMICYLFEYDAFSRIEGTLIIDTILFEIHNIIEVTGMRVFAGCDGFFYGGWLLKCCIGAINTDKYDDLFDGFFSGI